MDRTDVVKRFRIYKLSENERVDVFDCGDADLNDFVLNDAQPYRKAKLAVTYTIVDKNDNCNVAAFFCLSNDKISISDFDTRTNFNRFSKPC